MNFEKLNTELDKNSIYNILKNEAKLDDNEINLERNEFWILKEDDKLLSFFCLKEIEDKKYLVIEYWWINPEKRKTMLLKRMAEFAKERANFMGYSSAIFDVKNDDVPLIQKLLKTKPYAKSSTGHSMFFHSKFNLSLLGNI